jgi:hypothetical protein
MSDKTPGKLTRYRAYDELAMVVARRAERPFATPADVAGDEALRAKRDELWRDYELRLRDVQTYSLNDIVAWLRDLGASVGRSSIDRNRTELLGRERAIALAGERTAEIMKLVQSANAEDLLAGGTKLAAQLLFEALSEMSPAALEDATPAQWLQAIDTLSRLRKASAESDLISARMAALVEARNKVSRAADASPDGKLSRADVLAIIDEAMRGQA